MPGRSRGRLYQRQVKIATRRAKRGSLIVIGAILAFSAVHAETLAGRASVIDANTLDIHSERIRIVDIDVPLTQISDRAHHSPERIGSEIPSTAI